MKKFNVVLSVVLCLFFAGSAAQGQAFSDNFDNPAQTHADWNRSAAIPPNMEATGTTFDTTGPGGSPGSFGWVTAEPGGTPLSNSTYQIDVDINTPLSTSVAGSEAGVIFGWSAGNDWWAVRHENWNNGTLGPFSRLAIVKSDFTIIHGFSSDFDYSVPYHLTVNVDPTGISAIADNGISTLSIDTISNNQTGIFGVPGPAGGAGIYPGGVGNQYDNFNVTPEPMTLSLLGLGGLAALRRRKNA